MKKSRGMFTSVARMVCTFGGSYLGAKASGWLFDTWTSKRKRS